MHHDTFRLINDTLACCANGKSQVGVLVISRSVATVETIQFIEQRCRNHEGSAGHVIDIASIAESRVFRQFEAAVVPTISVGKDDPASFLQASVWVYQLTARNTAICFLLEADQQVIEPARGDLRVVVQEQQMRSASRRSASIAATDEAQIVGVAQH